MVTVRANFLMFEVLLFSHKRSVYISSTLVPSSLLVKVEDGTSFPSNSVLSVGRFGPLEIVPDRPGTVPDFGVRDAEAVGW